MICGVCSDGVECGKAGKEHQVEVDRDCRARRCKTGLHGGDTKVENKAIRDDSPSLAITHM